MHFSHIDNKGSHIKFTETIIRIKDFEFVYFLFKSIYLYILFRGNTSREELGPFSVMLLVSEDYRMA